MKNCEFCEEFDGNIISRFQKMYEGILTSRIVMRTENFVVLPTLGQIFKGSLLVLPINHVETCAQMNKKERIELEELVYSIMEKIKKFGSPVYFEHGATSASGGSCGIYHAHTHIVPLPGFVEIEGLFPEFSIEYYGMQNCLDSLSDSDQYLIIGNQEKVIGKNLSKENQYFPSQFFRKKIVESFEIDRDWNWKNYKKIESDILETVCFFRENNA